MKVSEELFDQVNFTYNPVRLIGLSITNLDNQLNENEFQLSFKFD